MGGVKPLKGDKSNKTAKKVNRIVQKCLSLLEQEILLVMIPYRLKINL